METFANTHIHTHTISTYIKFIYKCNLCLVSRQMMCCWWFYVFVFVFIWDKHFDNIYILSLVLFRAIFRFVPFSYYRNTIIICLEQSSNKTTQTIIIFFSQHFYFLFVCFAIFFFSSSRFLNRRRTTECMCGVCLALVCSVNDPFECAHIPYIQKTYPTYYKLFDMMNMTTSLN